MAPVQYKEKKDEFGFYSNSSIGSCFSFIFVIFKLSKKLDFTLLVIVALAAGVAIDLYSMDIHHG